MFSRIAVSSHDRATETLPITTLYTLSEAGITWTVYIVLYPRCSGSHDRKAHQHARPTYCIQCKNNIVFLPIIVAPSDTGAGTAFNKTWPNFQKKLCMKASY
jgi:hypothetical protein